MVDPRTEQVALRWLGSLNSTQLAKLLDDAERALAGGGQGSPEDLLARADRLQGEGKSAEAAQAYREALAAALAGWPGRPRAVESLLMSLHGAQQYEACARAATAEAPSLPRGPSFANAVALGLSCALSEDQVPWRAETAALLEPLATEALKLEGLLADDRSGLYELLVELATSRGNQARTRELAHQWLSFLQGEMSNTRTPEERTAFDSNLVAAALAAGEPERAIPPLERSERELPADYNPAARLAIVYRELGRHQEALAACERALAKVYGPRRLRLLETKATILQKRGEPAAARKVVEEALRFASTLPEAQRPERGVSRLRALLEQLR